MMIMTTTTRLRCRRWGERQVQKNVQNSEWFEFPMDVFLVIIVVKNVKGLTNTDVCLFVCARVYACIFDVCVYVCMYFRCVCVCVCMHVFSMCVCVCLSVCLSISICECAYLWFTTIVWGAACCCPTKIVVCCWKQKTNFNYLCVNTCVCVCVCWCVCVCHAVLVCCTQPFQLPVSPWTNVFHFTILNTDTPANNIDIIKHHAAI
jgi:hypothetical protein